MIEKKNSIHIFVRHQGACLKNEKIESPDILENSFKLMWKWYVEVCVFKYQASSYMRSGYLRRSLNSVKCMLKEIIKARC